MPAHTPATPQRPKGAVRSTDHLQRLTAQPGAVLYAVHNGRVEQWQQVELHAAKRRPGWPDCLVRRLIYQTEPLRGRRLTFAHTMNIGPVPAAVQPQPTGWLFALRANAEAYAAGLPAREQAAPEVTVQQPLVPDYTNAEMRVLAKMIQQGLPPTNTVAKHLDALNVISGKFKWY